MKKSEILNYLDKGGLLESKIKGFQPRQQQIELTDQIVEALTKNQIAFLEAGTGVGKTFSYLLPVLHYAHTHQKKVAISTHTIQLQEQLIKKDIPHLIKLLGFDLQVTLVLGMNNYLCLKRLSDSSGASEEIKLFSETSKNGIRPGFIPKEAWQEIRVDSDLCIGPRCSHFKECFFFKEREIAKNSQVLIFNHHLLVSELLSKREKNYDWIIVDEAHHFEEVVRSIQGKKVNYLDLIKLTNKLYLDGKVDGGRLNQLETMIDLTVKQHQFKHRFMFDLPAYKREVLQSAKYFFEFLQSLFRNQEKILIDEHLRSHPIWPEITMKGQEFLDALKRFTNFVSLLDQEIKQSKEEKLIEKSFALRHEMNAYKERLVGTHDTVYHALFAPLDINEVSWLSMRNESIELTWSHLDVAACLQEHLFKEKKGVVFLSATLSTESHFKFVKARLGVQEEPTVEGIYPSPFKWEKQALFLVPKDMSDPDSATFFKEASAVILEALRATYGHALILFTSYGALNTFYQELETPLRQMRYTPLKQGERGKQELIEIFKSSKSPVLFGTDSFWEGIDIVGDILRLVIILKLPFKVPDEPIVQAISKKLRHEKKDPFFTYFLPQAVVKFKQGFGRLIRHHEDRGVVLCLDHRIITKGYGKRFLATLPACQKEVIVASEVKEKIVQFFKRR